MDELDREIEIFRKEEEEAQQSLFAYLGIRTLLAERRDVLEMVNRNSMYWITSQHALLVNAFIALGRVFDQSSSHNIDLLLKMVETNLPTLNRDALRERKQQVISADQAAAYVLDKHATTIEDVRAMRTEVKKWRKIYEAIYKPIRHNFAHKKTADIEEVNALLAKANIDEMKAMLGFLHSLHEALRELHLNGRNPLPLPDVAFVLAPASKPQRQYHPGEKAYREAQAILLSMMPTTDSDKTDRKDA
jgi:hypothetical protein